MEAEVAVIGATVVGNTLVVVEVAANAADVPNVVEAAPIEDPIA